MTLVIVREPDPADPSLTIQQKFERFHADNPWIYDRLVELARDRVAIGHQRVGIGLLFEALRWKRGEETRDVNSDFKLNNNYRSRYVRLICAQEPDLADRFETRRLTAP